jgi:hypothetical protein
MSSRNLLQETIRDLEDHGKTTNDVLWVGSIDAGWLSWDEFAVIADFEYDAGYGGQEIASDLVVVGNGWWLDRGEYDGSEWWNFQEPPKMPAEKGSITILTGSSWTSLKEMNEKESED